MLLKYPAVPNAASDNTIAEAVFDPLIIMVFLRVLFVNGVVPVEPIW